MASNQFPFGIGAGGVFNGGNPANNSQPLANRFQPMGFHFGSKAHCSQESRTCQELLDFNMVAERELREIIAWDAWGVPIHREDLH